MSQSINPDDLFTQTPDGGVRFKMTNALEGLCPNGTRGCAIADALPPLTEHDGCKGSLSSKALIKNNKQLMKYERVIQRLSGYDGGDFDTPDGMTGDDVMEWATTKPNRSLFSRFF